MLVVSNTTAVTSLAAVNRLHLLHDLYGNIVIPEAVERELVEPGEANPGAAGIQRELWISTRSVSDQSLVAELMEKNHALDEGEADAIVLAREVGADLLIIDDGVGRRVAESLNIPITGVVGALLDAKERRLIAVVRPVIDDLIQMAGFYVAPPFYRHILDRAGEQT